MSVPVTGAVLDAEHSAFRGQHGLLSWGGRCLWRRQSDAAAPQGLCADPGPGRRTWGSRGSPRGREPGRAAPGTGLRMLIWGDVG